jgi:hypothetical protein
MSLPKESELAKPLPTPLEISEIHHQQENHIHEICFQLLCEKVRNNMTFKPNLSINALNDKLKEYGPGIWFSDETFWKTLCTNYEFCKKDRQFISNETDFKYNVIFEPRRLVPMFANVGYDLKSVLIKNNQITCTLRALTPPPYNENETEIESKKEKRKWWRSLSLNKKSI